MPNVSRLLNKLMEKGLIQKERNLSDQRVVYVKLTPAGEKLRIQSRQILNQISVLTNVVPFLLEDEMKNLGGIYSKGADWGP